MNAKCFAVGRSSFGKKEIVGKGVTSDIFIIVHSNYHQIIQLADKSLANFLQTT